MSFEVLELENPKWERVLAHSEADIAYRPEFCRFHLQQSPGRAVMFYYEDELGAIFDVTLLKDVSRLPFYSAMKSDYAPPDESRSANSDLSMPPLDLASPGYNGPLSIGNSSNTQELLCGYRSAVNAWCCKHNVVTEFVRIHPMSMTVGAMEEIEPLDRVSEVIYVDLREGYEAAWDKYSSKRRQEVRRAARNGATMSIVPPDEFHINRFVDLYDSTMLRKQTKSVYFYPREFFVDLFGELKERALLVEAYADDQLASSTIFFLGNKCVWAQYEGTDPSVRESDSNLYKTDRMISWSADHGHDYFLLGGGFHDGDGGYQYKMRYSKLTAPVSHLRKIHNPALLLALESEKAAYDRAQGRITRDDYFPSYWLT